MLKRALLLTLSLVTLVTINSQVQAENKVEHSSGVAWEGWSDDVFKNAKSQKKLVILNLEAIWCHWCHVMAEKTYSQKPIQDLLSKNFISIKVDQDSRPDLSVRYRDYGWPATIIFNSDGVELRKLAGFVEPEDMKEILEESVKNPVPKDHETPVEVDFAKGTSLDQSYRDALTKKHYESMDLTLGGLNTRHKYIDAETADFAFSQAARGNEKDINFLKVTLGSNQKLIDPAWGGVYQYSTHSDWEHPHFEKIMQSQADNLRLYAYGYALFADDSHWKSATSIYNYLKNFLSSPDGAFYTSQDADLVKGEHSAEYFSLSDSDRRKQGIPSIDKNIYSRENGLAIQALAALYAATGNDILLVDALRAKQWIASNRSLPDGGFKHGEKDVAGPFLSDSLSMAQALLALYTVTGDRELLFASEKTADFIINNFSDQNSKDKLPGFFISKPNAGAALKPVKNLSENIQLVRYFNLLKHFTGKTKYSENAVLAMQYVATPAYGSGGINDSGILLADYEINHDPLHVTIVGHKDDPGALALFHAGLKYFSNYKRIEWWDKREGAMPNSDVEYPEMPKAAAFICTNKRCSLPIFKPEGISDTIKALHKE